MLELAIAAAYLSYFVEIVVFPVPSVASSYQLLFPKQSRPSQPSLLVERRELPWWKRFTWFVVPTLVCIVLFSIPPLLIVYPDARSWMHPILALESPGFTLFGVLLIVIGRVWTFRSVIDMRGGFREPLRPVSSQPLRSGSSFRRSRNPGLVGMYLFYAGLALAFPMLELMVGFPIYVANMHYRVLLEESDLSARFGDEFRSYRHSTARYL